MNVTVVLPDGTMQQQDFSVLVKQKKYTILYFYPKDNTPGCTIEAKDFTSFASDFAALDTQIVGVSKDGIKSHCNFIAKQTLNIMLIADSDLSLHQTYGALGEKKMFGKTYQGTIRSTFLLDHDGSIVHKRSNVKAKGHAQKVLDYVQGL